jgi:hypothetical protein
MAKGQLRCIRGHLLALYVTSLIILAGVGILNPFYRSIAFYLDKLNNPYLGLGICIMIGGIITVLLYPLLKCCVRIAKKYEDE